MANKKAPQVKHEDPKMKGQRSRTEDGTRPNSQFPETTLEDLVGCARYKGPAKTLEEMETGIALGARERR